MKTETKKTLVKAAVLAVIAGAIAGLCFLLARPSAEAAGKFEYYSTAEGPESYTLENDFLTFNLDAATTEFTVTQKSDGKVWRSNPVDAESDPIALPKDMNYLRSTMLVTYSNANGVEDTYDSYSYSVSRDFFTVEGGDGFVRVNYLIGDVERTYCLPLAVTEERMDELVDQFENSERKLVMQYYRKYDIDNLRSSDNESELLSKYPILADEIIYVIRDGLPDYLKEKIEKVFANYGYGPQDYAKDAELYGGGAIKDEPAFNVSVEYRLDGKDLVVDVPFDSISYKSSFPATSLALLPYMGAGGTADSGFLFVPEGGGAIIRFNNGKTRQNAYYSDVYGWDRAIDRKAVITETRNSFPVFGISSGNSSFIAIAESGASWEAVNADVSGRYNSYNFAYGSYRLVHSEAFDVSGKSNNAVYIYEDSLPSGAKISQRYSFIESGNYVDMALRYREFFARRNPESRPDAGKGVPAAVEIIGAVDKERQVLGFPTRSTLALTSFDEAGAMLADLRQAGFSNLHVKLSGCLTGGITQKMLSSFKPLASLGGKSGLKGLLSQASGENTKVFVDGVTQYSYDSGITNGFVSFRDSAKFASSELAKLEPFSPIWYGKFGDPYYLLRPAVSSRLADRLMAGCSAYGAAGVSYREIGQDLSGDYNPDRRVSREESLASQVETLRKARSAGLGVWVSGGNDYAVPYADFVTGIDFAGNPYSITDESIPFYQIAIGPYVNYAGKPLNLAADYTEELLRSAECGAALSFTFMKADETALQDTNYTEYYGASFDSWAAEAKGIYARYNRDLGSAYGTGITGHRRVSESVTATDFGDGTRVFVNYGDRDFAMGDTVVPARDYVAVKGGEK